MSPLVPAPRTRLPRRGATATEVAIVFPVFLALIFGIIEFGRLQMVANLLASASREGARYGATEGVTSSQAIARVEQIVAAGVDASKVTTIIKDGSAFDDGGPYPTTIQDFQALPNAELGSLEPRDVFVVHTSVDYNDVAVLPIPIFGDLTLTGKAILRHE